MFCPLFMACLLFGMFTIARFHCTCKIFISRSSRPEVFFKKSVFKNIANFIGKDMCRSLFSNQTVTLWKMRLQHSCFPMNFAKFLRTAFLQNIFEWLPLSITIICQEHLNLNVRRMRATIFWSLAFTFSCPHLYCITSIYQVASVC